MISKYCERCHKRLNIGGQCSCTVRQRFKEYRSDDFYRSSDWLTVRAECIRLCCGLDIYSLLVNHTIEYGNTVHHIVPVEKDKRLVLAQDNLIYLTESNHRKIHSLYDSGKYVETVDMLRNLKKEFCRGYIDKLFLTET